MRIIPLIACTITLVVVATAAPNPNPPNPQNPGRYSSSSHYQFQRSSSAYRNNELQHKDEEAGAYGRIEDPDKYDKPLEQSHYRQTSYHAPGHPGADDDDDDDFDDSSEEQYHPSQTTGIKGGRPNSYALGTGYAGNYHRGGSAHFGQTNQDDSYYQPGRPYHHQHHDHNSGYNHGGSHYGHHGYHHQEGQVYQHNHGFAEQETSSQSSTNQNKDDQLISLDQTFDYSKFKDQGFGKEYLDNTEGQRSTTPKTIRSTTENIRPIFETTEELPAQPDSSSHMGNSQNQGQAIDWAAQFGSQTGQNSDNKPSLQWGITAQEGQTQSTLFPPSTVRQTTPQAQSTFRQSTQGGQSTFRTSTIGQSFTGSSGSSGLVTQSTNDQTFQPGQTIQEKQDPLKPFFEQIDKIGQMQTGDHTNVDYMGRDQGHYQRNHNYNHGSGRSYHSGHRHEITHHTTGYVKPLPQYEHTQYHVGHDEPDCGHTHHQIPAESHHKEEAEEKVVVTTEQPAVEMTTQQSFQEATTQATEAPAVEDDNKEMVDQGNGIGQNAGGFRVITETTTDIPTTTEYHYMYHQNHDHHTMRQQSSDKDWNQHQDSYGKFDYDAGQHQEDLTQQTEKHYGRMEFDGKDDLTQQHENGWTHFGQQEDLTQKHEHHRGMTQQQPEHHRDMTQQQQNSWAQFAQVANLTQKHEDGDLTQQQDNGWAQFGQQEDLTQKHEHHGDLTQQQENGWAQFGQQEDLTQKHEQHGDLTQQQENGWTQFGKMEDLSQKQEKQEEEYGHLEFGGQQQQHEDLSQKSEDTRYSTASSRTYSNSYGHTLQFGSEVQDVSQQVQKVENLDLEKLSQAPIEPEEEVAVVVEEKVTEKPGFWRRLGGSISRTYETAKEKVKTNLG